MTATSFHKVKRTTQFCLSRWLQYAVFLKNRMENTGQNRMREMTPRIQKESQLITSFLADFTNIHRLLLKGLKETRVLLLCRTKL